MSKTKIGGRPKELIATIDTTENSPHRFSRDFQRYEIHRKPVRDRIYCARHEDAAPGADGYIWSCTCSAHGVISPRGDAKCNHIERILVGAPYVFETPAPISATDNEFDNSYVKLTLLGERLLRWRWAAHALRTP